MSAITIACGSYIGSGTTSEGHKLSLTVVIREKRGCWLDYKLEKANETTSFHSEGSFTVKRSAERDQDILVYTIGGLPGQGRTGQVFEFDIEKVAGSTDRILTYDGVKCLPQEDTKVADRMMCAKCGEPIVEEALKCNGETYHKECFVCDTCKKPLVGKFSKTNDGRRLCEDCVPKRYCEACKKQISGTSTGVGGKFYHPECFKCEDCSVQLKGEFFKKNDRIVCKECVSKPAKAGGGAPTGGESGASANAAATPAPSAAAAPQPGAEAGKVCVRCKKPVTGEYVLGDKDDVFHEECFTCTKCNKSLDEGFAIDPNRKFKYQEANYLCVPCGQQAVDETNAAAKKQEARKCVMCKEAIDEESFTLLDGTSLHWRCFKCSFCSRPEEKSDSNTATLLRSKVEALKEGKYRCDKCMHGEAKIALGTYKGTCKGESDGAENTYVVKLLKNWQAWLDCTSKTRIASGTWHAEGKYAEVCGSDGTVAEVRFIVEKHPFGGGPEVGKTYTITVEKDGSGHALTCEGARCTYLANAVDIDESMEIPAGYPPAAKAPAPAPAAAAKPVAAPVPTPTPAPAPAAAAAAAEKQAEAAAPAAPAAPAAAKPDRFFAVEELHTSKHDEWAAAGVDPARREEYLSDADFAKLFEVSKEDFAKMPKWKRDAAKKKHGLF